MSQNADPAEIEAAIFPPAEPYANPPPSLPPAEPLRFSLVELLVATTAAAVLLALFRTLGIVGAVFAFVAALVLSLTIYSRDKQRQALLFDFVWGVVMPVVCFVFDPLVFKEGAGPGSFLDSDLTAFPWSSGNLRFYNRAFVAYPVLAWQLVALATVLVVGRLRGPWAAGFAGTLVVGLIVAGGIGMILLPFSAIGVFVMIGVLGFTPLLTAFSYGRRVRMLWARASDDLPQWKAYLCAIVGALLAAAIPGGLGVVLLGTVRGWDAIWR